jgi:G3E family GTPase
VLGDELETTLVELVDAQPELAAIVLETTGVAEPLPIAWAVGKPGSRVAERVRLAAVVTLVDADSFRAARPASAAVDAQVAYADAVLITKAERAGDAETHAVEAIVRELAPRALLRRGDADAHAAWLADLLRDPSLERPQASAPAHGAPGHVHDEHCRHADTSAHGIDSVWLEAPAELDLEELEDQLAALPGNYIRIKGIVRAVDARGGAPVHGWFAFHRVGLRVSSEPVPPPPFAVGRAVALGPGVEQSALAACMAAATA